MGITRVELGIQSIYDDILELNKRGHNTESVIKATKILKNYLLQGYAINEKRLLEQQKKEILKLQDTVSLIYNKIKTPILIGQEKELVDIIQRYTKSLTILGQYDFRSLKNTAKNKQNFGGGENFRPSVMRFEIENIRNCGNC